MSVLSMFRHDEECFSCFVSTVLQHWILNANSSLKASRLRLLFHSPFMCSVCTHMTHQCVTSVSFLHSPCTHRNAVDPLFFQLCTPLWMPVLTPLPLQYSLAISHVQNVPPSYTYFVYFTGSKNYCMLLYRPLETRRRW